MTPERVRLVLDSSAIVEFTRGSVHVGEVLSEIADEEGLAIVPALCLAEASMWAADRGLLDVLVEHRAVVVLPVEAGQWQALATLQGLFGRLDAAVAALLAIDADVAVLTRQPGLYAGVGVEVVEIGD